jgi:hypothetical protein
VAVFALLFLFCAGGDDEGALGRCPWIASSCSARAASPLPRGKDLTVGWHSAIVAAAKLKPRGSFCFFSAFLQVAMTTMDTPGPSPKVALRSTPSHFSISNLSILGDDRSHHWLSLAM